MAQKDRSYDDREEEQCIEKRRPTERRPTPGDAGSKASETRILENPRIGHEGVENSAEFVSGREIRNPMPDAKDREENGEQEDTSEPRISSQISDELVPALANQVSDRPHHETVRPRPCKNVTFYESLDLSVSSSGSSSESPPSVESVEGASSELATG